MGNMAKQKEISQEERDLYANWLKQYQEEKLSYQQIADKYGTNRTNVMRKIALAKNNVEPPKKKGKPGPKPRKPSNKEIARRNKISDSAIATSLVKQAPIIVNGIVNILSAVEYSIRNLTSIQDEAQEKSDNIVAELTEISDNVSKFVSINPNKDGYDAEKTKMLDAVWKAIAKASNFWNRDVMRIKAIEEIRKQMESYKKLQLDMEAFGRVTSILDAFFVAMDELDDRNYAKYRDKIIEIAPAVGELFTAYEKEEERNKVAPNIRTSKNTMFRNDCGDLVDVITFQEKFLNRTVGDRQKEAYHAVWGDKVGVWDTTYTQIVLEVGMKGGKNFWAEGDAAFAIYFINHLVDPHKFFTKATKIPIPYTPEKTFDIINGSAVNEEQARRAFFDSIKSVLKLVKDPEDRDKRNWFNKYTKLDLREGAMAI